MTPDFQLKQDENILTIIINAPHAIGRFNLIVKLRRMAILVTGDIYGEFAICMFT